MDTGADASPPRSTVTVAVPLASLAVTEPVAKRITAAPAPSHCGPASVTEICWTEVASGAGVAGVGDPGGVEEKDPPAEALPLARVMVAVPRVGWVRVMVKLLASSVMEAARSTAPAPEESQD